MEIEAKYTVADPEILVRLMNVTEIGPYQLVSAREEQVTDRYCDTADEEFRKAGYAFRFRNRNNQSLATLKGWGQASGAVHHREEFEAEIPADTPPADWPASELQDRVLALAGSRPLEELVTIRQRRVKRNVTQGDRTVGELSLDTVDTEVAGQLETTYEVELELKEDGTEDDLKQIEAFLDGYGLVPEPRSKLESALARKEARRTEHPLLTASEKAQLTLMAEEGDEVPARRARMILLYAAGKTSLEIGQEVGVSDSYVRRWLRNWKAEHLGVFPSIGTSAPEPAVGEESGAVGSIVKEYPETEDASPPVSVLQLCARYAVDMSHARHVADMSLALFDHFPEVHGLPAERRHLMEAAGLLHNIGLSVDPDKHHTVGRDLIRSERIEGLSALERDILACTTRFHRKAVKPKKEPIFAALPADIQRDVLAFSALLRTGDAFDSSVTQTSKFVSAKVEDGKAVVVLDGPHAQHEVERAKQKSDLWNEIFPHPIEVVTSDGASEPKEAAATEEADAPPLAPKPAKKKSPGVQSDDSMTEAGRKVLSFHYERLLKNEAGTREGVDSEALHDMRVATRRMRAAMRLFGPYLPPKPVKSLTDGLRQTGRALGTVRDLDVIMEKARQFRDSLPEDEAPDFDLLFQHWDKQRQSARKRMTDYLDGKAYAAFKRDFERFLQSHKEVRPRKKPKMGAVPDPHGEQVRHIAPSLIWEHYQEVRAYESVLEGADNETLHALRIDCKLLRYVLEFLKETLGDTAEPLISQITKAQDHLGELHDADVASELLRGFLGTEAHRAEKKGLEPEPLDGVAHYLEACEATVVEKVRRFPEIWEPMVSREFRQLLGKAAANL